MSAVLTQQSLLPPQRWRAPILALLLVVACLMLLYRDTLTSMVSIWYRSETFAHAFLVLPISLWLIWRDRDRLLPITPKPQPWLLLPMAVVAFVWLLGDLASVNSITQLAFTALLVMAVPTVLGLAAARQMAFPLAFLFFMVPIGDFMLPVLMEWTADFTVYAIQLSGVPVYREGLQFVIPTGSWSVVEACSGVRYMIASFMVGSLFAYLNYTTLRRRLIFCVISLIVPLVANWLRAYFIVMLGHLSNNKLAVGVDHLVYGWVFFGVVIGLMFFIGARWSEPLQPVDKASPVSRAEDRPSTAALPGVVLALGLLLAYPHALAAWLNAPSGAKAPVAFTLPELAGVQTSAEPAPLLPISANPASVAVRGYVVGEGVVTVHVAYYRHQGYDSKLVTSTSMLARSEDSHWQPASHSAGKLAAAGNDVVWRGTELLEGSVAVSGRQRKRLDVRELYWADGRFLASDHRASAAVLWGRLSGRGDDGAKITVYAEGPVAAETRKRLDTFMQSHWPAIEAQLVAYRQQR